MRLSIKLITASLTATLLLAAAVSTASATRLSVSNQNIRATWTSLDFIAPSVLTVSCAMTLEGSFHTRTIAKVARSLIGGITKGISKAETCTNGADTTFNGVERYNGTTTPNTLNWHLTYESFGGTLPNLTAVNFLLSRFRFGVTVPGVCIGQYGNETDNVTLRASRDAIGNITEIEPVAGRNNMTLIRRDGGIACPAIVQLSGRGTVTLAGNTTRITINLI